MTDPLDFVRAYYRALNERDVAAIVAMYAEDCVVEGAFAEMSIASPGDVRRGRDEIERAFRDAFQQYDGAFAAGATVQIRTIAGIETGWVHVEWLAGLVERATGRTEHVAGYSHFLLRDERITEQRTVAHPAEAPDPDEIATAPTAQLRGSRRYPARPIVGVGAVIFVDGKVVLIKRRFEPLAGQWSLPGGSLELGETLEAGVAREVLEETGLQVEVGPVIEVFDRILLDEEKKVRYHFVLIDYLCRPSGGVLKAASDVADVALVDPQQVAPYRLTPKAAAIIALGVRMSENLVHWKTPAPLGSNERNRPS